MRRIIVNNESKLSDADAVRCVHYVISKGRISGDSYCRGVGFNDFECGEIIVFSKLNKNGTDTFYVRNAFTSGGGA